MQDGKGNHWAKATPTQPEPGIAQAPVPSPVRFTTYLCARKGCQTSPSFCDPFKKIYFLTFIYAVWRIKHSTPEFWVAALPLRLIKGVHSLCYLVLIITEFWLIYYYADHLVKQPTYKPTGMSLFSSHLLELEQIQRQVVPLPCTQRRCSPMPYSSLQA